MSIRGFEASTSQPTPVQPMGILLSSVTASGKFEPCLGWVRNLNRN